MSLIRIAFRRFLFTQNTRTEILLRLLVQMLCMTRNTRPPQLKNATVDLPLNWNFWCAYSLEMTIKLVYILKVQYVWYIFYFSCHITISISRKIRHKKKPNHAKNVKYMAQTDVTLLSNSRFRDIYIQNRKNEHV